MPSFRQTFIYILVASVVLFALIFGFVSYNTKTTHEECLVSDVQVGALYVSSTKLFETKVETENCGTFLLGTDLGRGLSWWQARELAETLEVGGVYNLDTAGKYPTLAGLLSNIYQVEQVR